MGDGGGGVILGGLQDAISLPKPHKPSTLDPKPEQQFTKKNHLKPGKSSHCYNSRVRIVEAPQIGGFGSWPCASTAHAGGQYRIHLSC